jgi:peptide/nickel transport system permease protein
LHKYVTKRLLTTIPTLFFITFIIFAIMSFTPGDPGRLILGNFAPQESVDLMNKQLGYDQPYLIRFGAYIKNAVTLNFGNSYRSGDPVITEILARLPHTLALTVICVLSCSLAGISLGILAAVKQYSMADNTLTVLALFFSSVPAFWLGMMLIYLFSYKLGWFPTNGIGSWKAFVLPSITLTLSGIGGMLRLTRSTMLEAIRQDYIRTAKAKGVPQNVVVWRHALKNALLPVVTMIGMSFGGLLGGAVVVENVFSIPGIGSLLVNAIRMKDIPVVMGCTIFLSALFSLIMLLVDILYAYIDPRIKAKYES